MKFAGRWLVAVRNEKDDLTWEFYGVFGSKEAAQRKANAINNRLDSAEADVAMAYVAPLYAAGIRSELIAKGALA